MRGRGFAVAVTVLMLSAGCGDGPDGSTAQPAVTSAPAAPTAGAAPPSMNPQDCQDIKGVLDEYSPLFVAVQGKVLESIRRNDQKTANEGMLKAEVLVKEWAGLLEPQVAKVSQPDLHDALVTLLDQLRQYITSNGMNAGNAAKAADNVKTALGNVCA